MHTIKFILKIMFNNEKEKIRKKYNKYKIESNLSIYNKTKTVIIKTIPIILTVGLSIIGINGLSLWEPKSIWIAAIAFFVILFSIINIWFDMINESAIDDLYTFQKQEKFYYETVEYMKEVSLNVFKDTALMGQLLWFFGTLTDFMRQEKEKRIENLGDTIEKIVLLLKDTVEYTNDNGEAISIAIYLYDTKTEQLIDYFSKKSFIMKKNKRGRNWKINSESHLAHTFRSGEGRVIYDIRNFYPGLDTHEGQDYDDVFYRASITHPLTFYNKDKTVRGVFCVTSNLEGAFCEKDEFWDEKTEIRRLLSIKANIIIIVGMIINLLLDLTYPEGNEQLLQKTLGQINQRTD